MSRARTVSRVAGNGFGAVFAVLILLLPWLVLLGACLMAWWFVGALLSVTLGQIVVWAAFFCAGWLFRDGRGR